MNDDHFDEYMIAKIERSTKEVENDEVFFFSREELKAMADDDEYFDDYMLDRIDKAMKSVDEGRCIRVTLDELRAMAEKK